MTRATTAAVASMLRMPARMSPRRTSGIGAASLLPPLNTTPAEMAVVESSVRQMPNWVLAVRANKGSLGFVKDHLGPAHHTHLAINADRPGIHFRWVLPRTSVCARDPGMSRKLRGLPPQPLRHSPAMFDDILLKLVPREDGGEVFCVQCSSPSTDEASRRSGRRRGAPGDSASAGGAFTAMGRTGGHLGASQRAGAARSLAGLSAEGHAYQRQVDGAHRGGAIHGAALHNASLTGEQSACSW